MVAKFKSILMPILGVFIWICIWQLSALIISDPFILPDFFGTVNSALGIISTLEFYGIVLATLLRVICGLLIGFILGILFGYLSFRFSAIHALIYPLLFVMKSTPIASFIIILWLLLSGNELAIVVTFFMIFPVIYESVIAGFKSIDPKLVDVLNIYKIKAATKLKILIIPTLTKHLFPAMISSVGMAWKAEVAAEIIGYVKNSIGSAIHDAKYNFDSETVFGWTLIIIIFSVIFETLTRLLLRRLNK